MLNNVEAWEWEMEGIKMGNEDKTRILPEDKDSADKITKPGVEAILDRINKLGDELRGEIRQQGDELRKEMLGAINNLGDELRKEMRAGFDLLNRKLRILASEDLNRKAELEELEERIAELKRKAS